MFFTFYGSDMLHDSSISHEVCTQFKKQINKINSVTEDNMQQTYERTFKTTLIYLEY